VLNDEAEGITTNTKERQVKSLRITFSLLIVVLLAAGQPELHAQTPLTPDDASVAAAARIVVILATPEDEDRELDELPELILQLTMVDRAALFETLIEGDPDAAQFLTEVALRTPEFGNYAAMAARAGLSGTLNRFAGVKGGTKEQRDRILKLIDYLGHMAHDPALANHDYPAFLSQISKVTFVIVDGSDWQACWLPFKPGTILINSAALASWDDSWMFAFICHELYHKCVGYLGLGPFNWWWHYVWAEANEQIWKSDFENFPPPHPWLK